MADRLDAMTVEIQHEGTVIVGMILWPESWRAIVAPSTLKRGDVKQIDDTD